MYLRSFRSYLVYLSVCGLGAFAAPTAPGVQNFHQVNDHFYRGAQPTAEGYRSLAKLGVKTVINLRAGTSAAEAEAVAALGMRYASIPMHGLESPADRQMAQALALLEDSSAWPVFIHCRRGKDRTGTVAACYRIVHDGWQNQRALAEARAEGMSWFQKPMQHYILHFETERHALEASAPLKPAADPVPAAAAAQP
jgi:tyrosine-protein phosphatase SIW14